MLLRGDIAKVLDDMPKGATRAQMREAVKGIAESTSYSHNPQGVPVWESLLDFPAYEKAAE